MLESVDNFCPSANTRRPSSRSWRVKQSSFIFPIAVLKLFQQHTSSNTAEIFPLSNPHNCDFILGIS